MRRRLIPASAALVPALVALATVSVLATGWFGYELLRSGQLRPGQTHLVHASYVFDTSDRTKVAGFADYIVVGTVDQVLGVQDNDNRMVSTIFQVTVHHVLKGPQVDTLRLAQAGGTLGRDTWRIVDETPLRPGTSYVLAVRAGSGQDPHQVLGGVNFPVLTHDAAVSGDSTAVAAWRDAVRDQRWPEEIAHLKPADWPN